MENVNVGGRIYSVESIHELLVKANTDQSEQARAGANFELGAIQIYSALVSAQALTEISQKLSLLATVNEVTIDGTFAAPPAERWSQEEKLAFAKHDHPKLDQLRESVVLKQMPALVDSAKHGALKVFLEIKNDELVWEYTHQGRIITEDEMIEMLDLIFPAAADGE